MVDLTIKVLDWKKRLEEIWNVLEKSIPAVQAIILAWLNETSVRLDEEAKSELIKKLSSCEEAIKALPGHNSLFLARLFD